MLQQEAGAVVAARTWIVDGAVGMLDMALDHLKRDDMVDLEPRSTGDPRFQPAGRPVQRSPHAADCSNRSLAHWRSETAA
ncbi:hypothetical protein K239x_52240 [Planctomycetes bacterium K23_9]|uniref:Uncharacterized protein n=1 Tax=Stieleria marina TaxID=1930275 RepID=A0A517P1F4_9BACT|nr:hypothetical protein K239x_52240 [Planctomycetes bacterium K23_9]